MAATLQFSFDLEDRILFIGFEAGSEVLDPSDLDLFADEVRARCESAAQQVHFFFDLTHLTVATDLVEHFGARKRALCDRYALSTWHFGGNLAERVMTRNDLTRRGQRANLFRSREEALEAFHKVEPPRPPPPSRHGSPIRG
jgi:hypothetical protein